MRTDEQETGSSASLVMLRARITSAEWAEIRKLAIDEGLHNADLVAELLRRGMAARKAEAAAA